MASGVTNRGRYLALRGYFAGQVPANFFLAFVTGATAPNADTNVFSELTEIAAGNGYTSGGLSVARNLTDWDTSVEDDTNDYAKILLKDESWTASGGSIPGSGSGARYAVLLTDEATVANRQVVAWWDLGTDRTASSGQTIGIQDAEIRAT